VIGRILNELTGFSILGVRFIYAVFNMISVPRYELLIAQKSLVEPWIDCIESQPPRCPSWSSKAIRFAMTGATAASAPPSSVLPTAAFWTTSRTCVRLFAVSIEPERASRPACRWPR
jgi:hypothetical protein